MQQETERAYNLVVRACEMLSIYNVIDMAMEDPEYAHVLATLIGDVERYHARGEA